MITVRNFDAAGDRFDLVAFLATFIATEDGVSFSDEEIVVADAISTREIALLGAFSGLGTSNPSGTIRSIEVRENGQLLNSTEGLSFDLLEILEAIETDPAALENFRDPIRFEGSSNDDVFVGDVLDDRLLGRQGDDALTGGDGRDFINGGVGVDTADYSLETGSSGVEVNLRAERGFDTFGLRDTLISIENVTGSDFADRIFGDDGDNRIDGLAGNDVINAKGGDDSVFGGVGADDIVLGAGDDVAFGGGGDDVIGGRVGDDEINGGVGADILLGQLGDDTISGDDGADMINGGLGADTIDGGDGDDEILGRNDDDIINGGDGDDFINAGVGNDRIDGGLGDDVLIGGANGDIFVYDEENFGEDQIIRFNADVDRIEIDTGLAADYGALDFEVVSVGSGDEASFNTVVTFGGGSLVFVNRTGWRLVEEVFDFV